MAEEKFLFLLIWQNTLSLRYQLYLWFKFIFQVLSYKDSRRLQQKIWMEYKVLKKIINALK